MQKREHQTLVVSHTDGSDKYDRRVFGSCPFCALLARPRTLVRCLRVAVTTRVWPRPPLMWRALPGRGVAIKAKSQKAEPRRSESQITSPVNHTRVWNRPTLNLLITMRGFMASTDRRQPILRSWSSDEGEEEMDSLVHWGSKKTFLKQKVCCNTFWRS